MEVGLTLPSEPQDCTPWVLKALFICPHTKHLPSFLLMPKPTCNHQAPKQTPRQMLHLKQPGNLIFPSEDKINWILPFAPKQRFLKNN